MFPRALRFYGRRVLGFLTLILQTLRVVHRNLGKLGIAVEIFQVISPKPRLRLVMQSLPDTVLQVRLLGIDQRGKPDARAKILAPAVKVKVITGSRVRRVSPVKPHNVVILVFDPDAAKETPLAGIFFWSYVDYDAAQLSQKLPAYEVEVVILALKVLIENYHLGKAQRQEFHGVNVVQLAHHPLA